MRKKTAKRITIKCLGCGKNFEVRESRKDAKFCSNKCKYSVVNKKEDTFEISKRQLISWYHNHKMSLSDIAKELGCTKTTVRRKFKKFGIETRTSGQGKSIFLKTNPNENPNNLPGVKEKQSEIQTELNKDPEYRSSRINSRYRGIQNMSEEKKTKWKNSLSKTMKSKTPQQKYEAMKKQTDTKRKNGTLNCSGLENKYAQKLDDKGIKYIREYIIPAGNRRFRYDFYLPESKLLVEIQGNGTHANPEKYKADDVVKLGLKGWEIRTASEIWAKDLEKKVYAEESGYDVEYVWENELL